MWRLATMSQGNLKRPPVSHCGPVEWQPLSLQSGPLTCKSRHISLLKLHWWLEISRGRNLYIESISAGLDTNLIPTPRAGYTYFLASCSSTGSHAPIPHPAGTAAECTLGSLTQKTTKFFDAWVWVAGKPSHTFSGTHLKSIPGKKDELHLLYPYWTSSGKYSTSHEFAKTCMI